MPVLAFPGPAAPAPPQVAVEVPEGWHAVPAGPDLLCARGTGASGEPVEVCVRSHTAKAGAAAGDLVDALVEGGGEARSGAGREAEPPFVVDLGGREWVARHVSWDDEHGPVVEVHLASAVDDDPDAEVTRLVVATGRVRGAGIEADYDVLQSVLETLVVGGDA